MSRESFAAAMTPDRTIRGSHAQANEILRPLGLDRVLTGSTCQLRDPGAIYGLASRLRFAPLDARIRLEQHRREGGFGRAPRPSGGAGTRAAAIRVQLTKIPFPEP